MQTMLSLWIVGFILPWIAGVFLCKWDRSAILITAPIAVSLACIINTLGFAFDFWNSTPKTDPETLFGLPVELGLYPVTSGFSLFALRKGVRLWLTILVSSMFLTLVEGVVVLLHFIHYKHGWNIGWTFVSYVFGVAVVIGYSRLINPTSFQRDNET